MPKEVVYGSELFSGDEPGLELVAEVRWAREAEYVSLATLLIDANGQVPQQRKVDGGWYVNLDRSRINTLIRNLRRARDQAFGRDE